MSWRPTLLFLLLAPTLTACVQKDPVWELPCEERPAREVIPGTGEDEFRSLDDNKASIEFGDQGGAHIWFAVQMRGFGPNASIEFGITDPADPGVVYSGPLFESQKLKYDSGEEASLATGLFAFVYGYDETTMMESPDPSGKEVLFWAQVTDECTPEPVRGVAVGEVE